MGGESCEVNTTSVPVYTGAQNMEVKQLDWVITGLKFLLWFLFDGQTKLLSFRCSWLFSPPRPLEGQFWVLLVQLWPSQEWGSFYVTHWFYWSFSPIEERGVIFVDCEKCEHMGGVNSAGLQWGQLIAQVMCLTKCLRKISLWHVKKFSGVQKVSIEYKSG